MPVHSAGVCQAGLPFPPPPPITVCLCPAEICLDPPAKAPILKEEMFSCLSQRAFPFQNTGAESLGPVTGRLAYVLYVLTIFPERFRRGFSVPVKYLAVSSAHRVTFFPCLTKSTKVHFPPVCLGRSPPLRPCLCPPDKSSLRKTVASHNLSTCLCHIDPSQGSWLLPSFWKEVREAQGGKTASKQCSC